MAHSELALFPWENPKEKAIKIYRTWERYQATGQLEPGSVRPVVAESWRLNQRISARLDSLRRAPAVSLPDHVSRLARENARMTRVAAPILAEVDLVMRASGSVAVLADGSGCMIQMAGDPKVMEAGREIGVQVGGHWSETAAATNGIGTALRVGRPVQIFGAEHFLPFVHCWSCSAVPVRDPIDNSIVAVFNISGPLETAHSHTLGLAVASACALERELARYQLRQDYFVLEQSLLVGGGRDMGLVSVDHRGRILRADPSARQLLGLAVSNEWGLKAVLRPALVKHEQAMAAGQEVDPVRIRLEGAVQGDRSTDATLTPLVADGLLVGGILRLEGGPPPAKATFRSVQPMAQAFGGILGNSPALCEAVALAHKASSHTANVLILGETGTGKELLARAIHQVSPRRGGPFVPVNCGALAPGLIGSELFGYEGGAFTGSRRGGAAGKFEAASGGTLFLDEVGDLPPEQQVYLLRVLQDRIVYRVGGSRPIPVDVRVIAATNRNLETEVAAGRFRQDLYFRLNVLRIDVPPLRTRPEDVGPLVSYFLQQFSDRHGLRRRGISQEALALLQAYPWPGNVRELENVLEQAAVMCEGHQIEVTDLPMALRSTAGDPDQPLLDAAERRAIELALARSNGVLVRAARELGISRSTLYRKLDRYGLRPFGGGLQRPEPR